MRLGDIRLLARKLKLERSRADVSEAELRCEIDMYCSASRGNAQTLANACDLKPQYICDLRRARRSISDQVVDRLGRLK